MIKRGRGWSGVQYNIITLDQNGGVVSKMITYSNLRGGYIVLVYYGHHYGYQVHDQSNIKEKSPCWLRIA